MFSSWTRSILPVSLAAALVGCGVHPNTATVKTAGGPQAAAFTQARTVARIHFTDPAQLEALEKAGVDLFENVDRVHGTVSATLTAISRPALEKSGLKFEVLQSAEAVAAKGGMPSGYRSVDQVYAELKQIAQDHPDFVKLVEIGKSLEGRSIFALNFTSKPGQGLPSVRINSGQHARELPPVELTTNYAHLLADSYGKDQGLTRLVDTRDIWIVPIVNPDGRFKVQEGNSMWRKNTRKLGMGAAGVDTNRNADDHWDGGNSMQWADDYHGAAPFSEPESQALRDLCAKLKFKSSLDVHNYAGMILWPPGYSNEFTKDEAHFKAVGSKLADHLHYKAGTIARTIYKTYGDLSTWEYDTFGTLAFGAELADSGFSAPISEAQRDWKDWQSNFTYLIDEAGNPGAKHLAEGPMLPMPGLF
jgi:hypothetical protein